MHINLRGGFAVARAWQVLGGGHRMLLGNFCSRRPHPSLTKSAYSARVDRLNAIRLLQALVAAGANTRAPMDNAWVDKIAVRDVSLHGTELASAIAYAEAERWLADSPARGDYFTRTGEIVAKESVI